MSADQRQKAADQLYSTEGLPGLTVRLTIKQFRQKDIVEYRLYVRLAYFPDESGVLRLNFIDITCGGEFDYTTRRLITMICEYVRRELRHGLLTEETLIRSWRGMIDGTNSFEPQGFCAEITRQVCSPLDAVARWMEMRDNHGSDK